MITITNPLQWQTFTDLVNGLLNWAFALAIAIVPIMVVIGGFMFLFSEGNPEKIKKARELLMWTVIGFAVLLLSKGVIPVIKDILTPGP